MAFPSVTYTFASGATITHSEHNQNFTDIINGISDGTKDIRVLTAKFPGNSQLLTMQASSSMSATWTFTLPVSAGSANFFLQTNGSGVSTWAAVDLSTTGATGVAPIARGGTNKALTLSAGGMIWCDSDSFEVLSAGTAGQHLTSGGTSTPAWTTATFPSTAAGTGTFLRAASSNWSESTLILPNAATANRIFYATSSNTVGTGSLFNYDGTRLNVNTAQTSIQAGIIGVDFSSASQAGIGINDTNSGNGGAFINFASGATPGTTRGSITNNNNTGVLYNITSDYRYKENIGTMSDALEKVMLLKPCTYTWKHNKHPSHGFIAHEVKEIIDGVVTGEKDAINKETGEIIPQQIDHSKLVPLLTKAIQELTKRVEALGG